MNSHYLLMNTLTPPPLTSPPDLQVDLCIFQLTLVDRNVVAALTVQVTQVG